MMDCLLQLDNRNPFKIILKDDNLIIGKLRYPTLLKYNVAEEHASLVYLNGSWYIENLDNEYEILINSARIGSAVKKLKYGDIIKFSRISFQKGFVCRLFPEYIDESQNSPLSKFDLNCHERLASLSLPETESLDEIKRRAKIKDCFVYIERLDFKDCESLTPNGVPSHASRDIVGSSTNITAEQSCPKTEFHFLCEDSDDIHSDSSVVSENRSMTPTKYKSVDSVEQHNLEKEKEHHNLWCVGNRNSSCSDNRIEIDKSLLKGSTIQKNVQHSCMDGNTFQANTNILKRKGINKHSRSRKFIKSEEKSYFTQLKPLNGSRTVKNIFNDTKVNNQERSFNVKEYERKLLKRNTADDPGLPPQSIGVSKRKNSKHIEKSKTCINSQKESLSNIDLGTNTVNRGKSLAKKCTNSISQNHPKDDLQKHRKSNGRHGDVNNLSGNDKTKYIEPEATPKTAGIRHDSVSVISSKTDTSKNINTSVVFSTNQSSADKDKSKIPTREPSMEELKAILQTAGVNPVSDNSYHHGTACEINGSATKTIAQKENEKLNFYMKFIKRIVEMNTKWPEEQEVCKEPPPDVQKGSDMLPLSFKSYDQYATLFFSMIMLETWESICLHSKRALNGEIRREFRFVILHLDYKNDTWKMTCSVEETSTTCAIYARSLVILHLKYEDGSVKDTFGFITAVEQLDSVVESVDVSKSKKLPSDFVTAKKCWKIEIYVKLRENVQRESLMTGNVICNLDTAVKQIHALSNIKYSPFLHILLAPEWNTLSLHSFKAETASEHISRHNLAQIVHDQIMLSSHKVILLQGPSRSGKTDHVVRIVEKLIVSTELNIKILITSSSSVALDELGCRLINLKAKINSLQFTRIGKIRYISPEILPYSLDSNLQAYNKKYAKLKSELKNIREQICAQQCLNIANDSVLKNLLETERKMSIYFKNVYEEPSSYMTRILNNAQIVFSLIDDCSFLSSLTFSCCFIEEANQASESQTLLPLTLNISKFILIGDPMGIPPRVNSTLAIHFGFRRSLLERFHVFFSEMNEESPGIILSEPMNIHPQIAYFPYKHYYGKLLDISAKAIKKFQSLPLNPYVVFNRRFFPDFENIDAVGIRSSTMICKNILKICKTLNIGIIVPSSRMLDAYKSAVCDIRNPRKIEIGTVEAFQGKGMDVIILSCFHSSNSANIFACKRTLNVALTRASKCLIIHGYLQNIENFAGWYELIYDADLRNRYITYSPNEDFYSLLQKYVFQKV